MTYTPTASEITRVRLLTGETDAASEWTDARISEILMKNGTLYARASQGEAEYTLRLYPLGEKTFGIKDLDADLIFGDGTLTLYGQTGTKLKSEKETIQS